MNYTIRRTSPTTARIALESSEGIDPARKPEIRRFSPGRTSVAEMSTGAVLGREPGKTCALIVHVRLQDLICVREKLREPDGHCWRYFRIGSEFIPVALDLPNRCLSKQECLPFLSIKETDELDQIDFTDEGLRSFFAQRHPAWLQAIADRQIAHWQQHKPDKFFRLAPTEAAGSDIPRSVAESPFAALARFQDRLNKTQLTRCLRRCPRAAVMFALDKIPPCNRKRLLVEHAKDALLFAADRLADDELALCAKYDMFSAFQCRNRAAPERQAILLANSYMIASSPTMGNALAAIQEEMRASIIGFPDQWRASDPGGFPSILCGLMDHVGMDFDPEIINALLKTASSEDQQALTQVIAPLI